MAVAAVSTPLDMESVTAKVGPIRVVLADDEHAVRDWLRAAFAADGRIELVAEAADGSALLAALPATGYDAVLLDLEMPGRSGLQVLEGWAGQPDRPIVVVMSGYDDAVHVDRALGLGAQGYVLKGAPIEEIVSAISHAVAGGIYLQPTVTRDVLQRHLLVAGSAENGSTDLSPRQLELLRALAIGMTNKEIAQLLNLMPGTVNDYMKDLFHRLGVASRAAAVSTGLRRGLIT
jgi:DNA-binding NarL/FixJ family response regulator